MKASFVSSVLPPFVALEFSSGPPLAGRIVSRPEAGWEGGHQKPRYGARKNQGLA